MLRLRARHPDAMDGVLQGLLGPPVREVQVEEERVDLDATVPTLDEAGASDSWALALSQPDAAGEADVLASALGFGDGMGAGDEVTSDSTPTFPDEMGALDDVAFAYPILDAAGEADAGSLGETVLPLAGEEEGADDDISGDFEAVFPQGEGHADPLTLLLDGVAEGQGAADVVRPDFTLPTAFEEQGAADAWFLAQDAKEDEGQADAAVITIDLQGEANNWVDQTSGQRNVNHSTDTSLPLINTNGVSDKVPFLVFDAAGLKDGDVTPSTNDDDEANVLGGEGHVWQFDASDEVGGSTNDAGPYRQSTGGTALSVSGPVLVDGLFGKAYQFDGVNDTLFRSSPNRFPMKLVNLYRFTVALLLQVSGNPASEKGIVGTKSSTSVGSQGWLLTLLPTGRLKFYLSDGTTQREFTSDGTTTLTDGGWHRVCVRRRVTGNDATALEIFIDWTLNGTDSQASNPQMAGLGSTFIVGAIGSTAGTFIAAVIDELRIYKYDVSTAALANIYLAPYRVVGVKREIRRMSIAVTVDSTLDLFRANALPVGGYDAAVDNWNRRYFDEPMQSADDSLPAGNFGPGVNRRTTSFTLMQLGNNAALDILNNLKELGKIIVMFTIANGPAVKNISGVAHPTQADRPVLSVEVALA